MSAVSARSVSRTLGVGQVHALRRVLYRCAKQDREHRFHVLVYQVGTDLGFCIRISPADGSWTCEWTTFLAKGQINVAGPYYDTKNSVLAIIGGTGVYRTRAVR
jgi:hypothetical protein